MTNPATGEPSVVVHEADDADVDVAVRAAQRAQRAWAEVDGKLARKTTCDE